MDNTTTTTTTGASTLSSSTLSPLEQFYAFFVNPVLVVQFYQFGYPFTFVLGFIGNISSLLTFSRPTLRKVSTGCLFIVLAISDLLYLFICIFDFLEFGLKVPFYRHVAYSELCRFRTFTMNVAQISSAWILVIVSLDRWIRTRFPFKSGSICTPKKALVAVGIMLILDVGLNAHVLTPMFGMLIPGYVNGACGGTLSSLEYMLFYYLQWGFIQIFTTCLIPVFLMLIILLDIFISVRLRKRAVAQPTQVWQNDANNGQRQKNLHKQMFILMFASICIFFITNLPFAIGKIVLPRDSQVVTSAARLTTIWTILGWFQSLNYAVNFYTHCLSSTLFRNEFRQQIRVLIRAPQTQVSAIETSKAGQRALVIQIKSKH